LELDIADHWEEEANMSNYTTPTGRSRWIGWIVAVAILTVSGNSVAQTSQQAARWVAENNTALMAYSWTTRVEVTTSGGEQKVGLFKVRYDLDENVQATPTGGGEAEEILTALSELGAFVRAYARSGAYEFQQFMQRADVWEGRGEGAGTVRIEGTDLHRAGDEVIMTITDRRIERLEAQTAYLSTPLAIAVEYRALPDGGPSYPARMVMSWTNEELDIEKVLVETFDYVASGGGGPARSRTVPQGTSLTVRTTQPLSTKSNQAGQTFEAVMDQDVMVDGISVITRGSRVVGRIAAAEGSGRVSGRATMTLVLSTVYTADGPKPVETEPLAFEAEGTKRKDTRRIGTRAGLGALIGGIAGGGEGAAKGAVIGGAVGTVGVLATKGDEVEFPAEQLFSFRLTVPTEVAIR
jgi:hypothetical protein